MIKALKSLQRQTYADNLEDLKLPSIIHVTDKIIPGSSILKGHCGGGSIFSHVLQGKLLAGKVMIWGFLTLVECIYLN